MDWANFWHRYQNVSASNERKILYLAGKLFAIWGKNVPKCLLTKSMCQSVFRGAKYKFFL